jgi:hypothetical protein
VESIPHCVSSCIGYIFYQRISIGSKKPEKVPAATLVFSYQCVRSLRLRKLLPYNKWTTANTGQPDKNAYQYLFFYNRHLPVKSA